MEIIQNGMLKINNIKDADAFIEFMEEKGGMFAEEMDDDIADSTEIEVMDAYEEFDDMIDILKAIATEFPEITMTLEGEEETSYDGIEYKMTYKDNVMKINTTERFYKLYPEEYEEYVDYCEDFQVEDVVEEEVWNAMNEDADQGWYFIEGVEAKTSIEFTEEQIIKLN